MVKQEVGAQRHSLWIPEPQRRDAGGLVERGLVGGQGGVAGVTVGDEPVLGSLALSHSIQVVRQAGPLAISGTCQQA